MEMMIFAMGMAGLGTAALWIAVFGIDIRINHTRDEFDEDFADREDE